MVKWYVCYSKHAIDATVSIKNLKDIYWNNKFLREHESNNI